LTSPTHFHYRSFSNIWHHQSFCDHQITKSVFIDDVKLHVFKADNKNSGFGLKQFDYLL
jgi:hypothetical protein